MSYIEVLHSYKRYHIGEQEIVANRDLPLKKENWLLYLVLPVRENPRFSIYWAEWIPMMKAV